MSASDFSVTDPVPALTPEAAAAGGVGPTWQDQDSVLRDMWLRHQTPQAIADTLNRSVAAIMTRAARLGLPRRSAPGRKPGLRRTGEDGHMQPANYARTQARITASETAPVAVHTSLRVCLMCLTRFESLGRHNRICSSCKGSSEYESASGLPEIHMPTA